MPIRIPTTEKLAVAMEVARVNPALITRAREGYYDDLKSPVPFPQYTLLRDLRLHGHHFLASRVTRGEFYYQRWEWREWMLTDEARHTFRGRVMDNSLPGWGIS